MNTQNTFANASGVREFFVFPDPPERTPEDLTGFRHLSINGNAYLLREYLGNTETTLVAGERYLSPAVTRDMKGVHSPDFLVAFDVDPAAYKARKAYVVSDQGKPPDFVLEVASPSTARIDVIDKRVDYARWGIPEYWRFDQTGEFHGARLAGDRLVGSEYEPIPIEEVSEDELRGYSSVLNVYLRWREGELSFCDPVTGSPLPSLPSERSRAADAERGLASERSRAADAERGLASERAARLAAEARVRELEEQLRRQGDR